MTTDYRLWQLKEMREVPQYTSILLLCLQHFPYGDPLFLELISDSHWWRGLFYFMTLNRVRDITFVFFLLYRCQALDFNCKKNIHKRICGYAKKLPLLLRLLFHNCALGATLFLFEKKTNEKNSTELSTTLIFYGVFWYENSNVSHWRKINGLWLVAKNSRGGKQCRFQPSLFTQLD